MQFKYADLTAKTRMSLFGQNDSIDLAFSNNTIIECLKKCDGIVYAVIPTRLIENRWRQIVAVDTVSNVK